jgi:succinate dehydrogenase hydrophobic anchor subunit
MGNLVYRIVAIITVVLGLGVTVFALMAAYRTDDDWARVLFTLGLPSSLLLPAMGALLAVIGVLMFVHAVRGMERGG